MIKKILTSWLRNTTIVFTLNMESCFMLIGRCHGNDEWRMDFFRRLIQRLSWIMVSSFAQLKARNEKERKTAKCWQLWLYKPWNRCSPPNKRTYFPTSICLASLSRAVGGATHWLFLEIFVRKFKRGNQRVLLQNWVKNVGINKCSLSKN